MSNETASARFEIVPDERMPNGYPLVQVEIGNVTILAVRGGDMRPELRDALNRDLEQGLWSVNARFEIRPDHRMPRGSLLAQYGTPEAPLLAVRTRYMKPRLEQALNRHLARCMWAAGQGSDRPQPSPAARAS